MYVLEYTEEKLDYTWERNTEFFKTKAEAVYRAEIIIITKIIRPTIELYKEESMHTSNLVKRTYYKRISKHKWVKEK